MESAKNILQLTDTNSEVSNQEKTFLVRGTDKIPIYAENTSKYSLSFRYLGRRYHNQPEEPVRLLINNNGGSIELGGTLFTICPWWDGPNSRAQVEKQLLADSLQSPSKWVWVHHAPPDGSPVSWTGKRFAGDAYLVGWIERFKPDMVLSGHIHNSPFLGGGSWMDQVGDTWVFNPGRQPGPHPTLITLDLDEMQADWFSAEEKESRSLRPERLPG